MLKAKRLLPVLLAVLMISALAMPVAASTDVGGVIKETWDNTSKQIKTVVDSVVFPALAMILGIAFFVKLGAAWFDYRKHGQFEFAAPCILFVCLLFVLTAKLYIWRIIGIP